MKTTKLPQTIIKINDLSVSLGGFWSYSKHHQQENLRETRATPTAQTDCNKNLQTKIPLPVVAAFEAQVAKGNKQSQSMFYVIQGDSFSILRYDTSTELGLIKIVETKKHH